MATRVKVFIRLQNMIICIYNMRIVISKDFLTILADEVIGYSAEY
jgi:hypothetical protein